MTTELRPMERFVAGRLATQRAVWMAVAGALPGNSARSAVMVTRLPEDSAGTDHYLLVAEPEGKNQYNGRFRRRSDCVDNYPPATAERLADAIRAGGLADLIRPGGGYALRVIYYDRQPGDPTGKTPNSRPGKRFRLVR